MAEELQVELDLWQKKFRNSEENLSALKKLCIKAIHEFSELQLKYNENQQQYAELAERLEVTETQLEKLQSVSEAVYDEYMDVTTSLDVEKNCREEAEKYAANIVKENKQLKRASQMFIQQHGGQLPEIPVFENGDDSEVERLNARNRELSDELSELKLLQSRTQRKLEKAEEDIRIINQQYVEECTQHQETKKTQVSLEETIKKFQRVSVLALGEYQDLRSKFDMEKSCRVRAESYAAEMLRQQKAMARQSVIVMQSVAADERLTKSLQEVEELTTSLEQERFEHEQKIKEMEEQVTTAADVEELEKKVTLAMEETEAQEKRAQEAEEKVKALEKQVKELEEKLLQPIPPPPPPPLPPPPPPPVNPIRSLISILGQRGNKKKPQAKGKDGKELDPRELAMREMMDRIRSGKVQLRPTRLPGTSGDEEEEEKENKDSAIKEMTSLLRTIKKTGRPQSVHEENELMKTLQRRRQITDRTQDPAHRKISEPVLPSQRSVGIRPEPIAEEQEPVTPKPDGVSPSLPSPKPIPSPRKSKAVKQKEWPVQEQDVDTPTSPANTPQGGDSTPLETGDVPKGGAKDSEDAANGAEGQDQAEDNLYEPVEFGETNA
ncbi:PREDICTED: shootin-1-like [Branchiostoma belcheri]|uniref:Shootin-1-like n=1 Tax=Branchiostoma belcheri TaxID=7741 RepID=A0A6P4ZQ57_BRABE|nr:PREDICTED: shootin-1-like [Branchiostoma belcheri]